MNIIVCAKEVIDVSEIKIDTKTNTPITKGIDKKISDIDKNAVEEAVRIKEKLGGKITVVSVGPSEAREYIKELLAMGADEAKLVPMDDTTDHNQVASVLSSLIKGLDGYDIVLCAEASIDLFSGQMAPRLAQKLGAPQITYVKNIEAEEDKLSADRDLGDKKITVESSYPVVISVTKEINEPRLPSLMEILGAANKPIEILDLSTLEGSDSRAIERLDVKGVTMERKNMIYKEDLEEAIKELVDQLAKNGVLG